MLHHGKKLHTKVVHVEAGILNERIFFVGNVMIDTLLANMPQLKKYYGVSLTLKKEYLAMTMHRPANLDEEQMLKAFMSTISENVQEFPVIFPMHPRTKQIFEKNRNYSTKYSPG